MEIKGKVHCFFEQSGTFKNEFIKLGIPAEDYDIQNNFGQTDHIVDLFSEIEKAYEGGASIFDSISCDDLIMAFFPCIYFSCVSQMAFRFSCINYRKMSFRQKTEAVLERAKNREAFYGLAIKMICVAENKGIRLVMENPWSEDTYLKENFILPPSIIDNNRMLRGDYREKPTAYWCINFIPHNGFTLQYDKLSEKKTHMKSRPSGKAGLCSEERSMISPDYARNFICDFILGKSQPDIDPQLF